MSVSTLRGVGALCIAGLVLACVGCGVAPKIRTDTLLPWGTEGKPYAASIHINADAGEPITWIKVRGPEKLTLTPSRDGRACSVVWPDPEPGMIQVSVAVQNAAGRDNKVFMFPIEAVRRVLLPPKIKDVRLPDVRMGSTLEFQLEAEAGTPPLRWFKSRGADGVKIGADGKIVFQAVEPTDIWFAVSLENRVGQDLREFAFKVLPTPEYGKGKDFAARLRAGAIDVLPGDVVLYLRSIDTPEKAESFKRGFHLGYGEGGKPLTDKMVAAATDRAYRESFSSGLDVGQKLAGRRVSDADVRDVMKHVLLAGDSAMLAWQAGFIIGYGENARPILRAVFISLR